MHVCRWHVDNARRPKNDWGWRGDVRWARRYLEELVEMEFITADDAAAIREACGWMVQGVLI